MSVDVTITAPGCCASHSVQLTYNYSPALAAAGAPSWRLLDNLRADMVGIIVGRVRLMLTANREKFEPMILGEGEWGSWDHLLECLDQILAACDLHPDAMVRCG